jgi:hypothetical protein
MRDVVAIAGVIVVALGLGGGAAYLSVDFTPPGLDLIRPPQPAVVAQIKKVEQRKAVQAKASGCKYCADLADLAETFSRRAETARTHASALKKALPQVSDETALVASRKEELKQAQIAAERADEAAAVLTQWASRCTAEDFCRAPLETTKAATCVASADPRADAAIVIAAAVRKAAESCASASCPSVDCQATGALRSDVAAIERALDGIGGRDSASAEQIALDALPVGPSTLKAEVKRINDEAGYVARMLPLLLDPKKKNSQLPKMASEMIDERAVSASTLATVMEQAVQVSDARAADPRYEASWRLKSLAANLAALGKDSQPGRAIDWRQAADALGSAFMDLARLDALVDRASAAKAAGAGCDTTAASAAQQLREAAAMLDVCRMRSACVGRGGASLRVKSEGDAENVFARAQAVADSMIVDDLGPGQLLEVAQASDRLAIEVLRDQGVCRRAGELREAKAAAPEVAVAVAEQAVTPALAPTTAVAPQDLVGGAMQAALDAPASSDNAITEAVVEEVARYSNSSPRFKPRRMQASDPDVVRVASPPPAANLTPAYQGVVLPEAGAPQHSFGDGAGGPTRATPPAETTPKD